MCNDGNTVVVMCDECHSIWIDARHLDRAATLDADPPDFRVPGSPCSLLGSRWAQRAEVERAGWGDLIAGEGVALDGG